MGDFLSGDTESVSRLSPAQQKVQNELGGIFSGFFSGQGGEGLSQAFLDLISGSPQDLTAINEAAFRNFNEYAVPGINAQFAGLSATQNSRRVGQIARAAGDVTSQLAGIHAQTIEGARNRQSNTLLGIINAGSGFANASTVDTIKSPSMFGQLLQLGGTLGSAAILGAAFGPAGAALALGSGALQQ